MTNLLKKFALVVALGVAACSNNTSDVDSLKAGDTVPRPEINYNGQAWTVNGDPVPGDCGAEDSCVVRMVDGEYRAVPVPH